MAADIALRDRNGKLDTKNPIEQHTYQSGAKIEGPTLYKIEDALIAVKSFLASGVAEGMEDGERALRTAGPRFIVRSTPNVFSAS